MHAARVAQAAGGCADNSGVSIPVVRPSMSLYVIAACVAGAVLCLLLALRRTPPARAASVDPLTEAQLRKIRDSRPTF